MKNRKMRLIIGMLVGLVLFSSSVALLLYVKQGKTHEKVQERVEVYISSRDIKRGELIQAQDIEKASLPPSYLAVTPLMATEIIGRYADVKIFAKEPFRKEKLSLVEPQDNRTIVQVAKAPVVKKESVEVLNQYDNNKDTITMPLSIFKNIDESLKAGDYIDIITLIPNMSRGKIGKFSTKYVAVHILINSFISNSSKVKSVVSRSEEDGAFITTSATSVVFDVLPGDVKNLLSSYYRTKELNSKTIYNPKRDNRGHLWMVKCTTELNPTIQKYKKKMLVDHVTVYKKKKRKVVPKVSISYED